MALQRAVINPRRACARVTVVVCLSVCAVFVRETDLPTGSASKRITKGTSGMHTSIGNWCLS